MTLEEIDFAAIEASMEGDMDALESALAARDAAIRFLLASPPSEELLHRLQDAMIAGESIKAGLAMFRASRRLNVVA